MMTVIVHSEASISRSKTEYRAIRIVFLATTALFSFSAWGQQSDAASPDDAAVEAKSNATSSRVGNSVDTLTEDIIVTAQKRGPESAQNVPIAITAFGDKQLEALNVRDLKGLTYTMPNVQLDSVGSAKNTANFTIRGLGLNTSVPSIDPTVGVFVNGIYLGVTSGVIMDDFDLEGVEVLRGPQGVLFGRNVTGGAVLIRTKRPTKDFEGTVSAGIESGLKWTVNGSLSGPIIEDIVSVRLSSYYSDDAGYFDNGFTGRKAGASETFIIRPSVLITPSTDLDLTLRFEHGEQNGDGAVFQNDRRFRTGSFGYEADTPGFTNSNWNSASVEANWRVGPGDGTITALGGWREYQDSILDDIDGTRNAAFNLQLFTKQNQRSAELRYAGSFGDFKLTVGGFYFQQNLLYIEGRAIDSNVSDAVPPTIRIGGGTGDYSASALFGSLDWEIIPTLTLNAGVRYTNEKKKSDLSRVRAATDSIGGAPGQGLIGGSFADRTLNISDANLDQSWNDVAPRFGIQWKPDNDLQFYASWTKGFRSGGLNIRSTGLGAPPVLYDPETQYAIEAGAKADLFDRRLRLNVNLFRNRIKGAQRDNGIPDSVLGTVQVISNAGNVTLKGIEAEGRLKLTDNLLLTFQGGHTVGKYTKLTADLNNNGVIADPAELALRQPRLVPWTYGASLVHDLSLGSFGSLSTRVSFNHRDAAFYSTNNAAVLRSANIIDAGLTLTPDAGNWSLSVYGNNLTNRATWDSQTKLGNTIANGGDGLGGTLSVNALNKGRVFGARVRLNF